MKFHLTKQPNKVDLTIAPCFLEEKLSEKLKLYGLSDEAIRLAAADFRAKPNELHLVYSPKFGRLLLLGTGERRELTPTALRNAMQSAIAAAKKFKPHSVQVLLTGLRSLQSSEYVEIIAFACLFANYSFNYYKQDQDKVTLDDLYLVGPPNSKAIQSSMERGGMIAAAANQARDLANHPANVATPSHLAKHALELAKKYRLRIKILNVDDMKKQGMGLLLGVSRGSDEPPKLIVIEYLPAGRQVGQPIVLIGKGLTFDSGGISIKPAERMEEMKYDMCGGATVLGILEAAAQLKLNLPLVGIIPSSENLLSGRATKPGDILSSMSGKNVEIINTDAEGRLILADAITYAKKYYKPRLIMDYATLTGAVIVALGDEFSGTFSNTNKYNQQLSKASQATGEKLWLMPLAQEYKDQLKSGVADLKNVGEKGVGGAITASLFLSYFVEETPWIHFDIAGTAWTMKNKSHMPAGATGWGVYHAIHFFQKLK